MQIILEIADVVSAAEYRKFEDKHKDEVLYMTHTLITYVFNIFSVFIKMAKNPTVVRKFKIDNAIDPKGVKIALMMHKSLLDQLQLCCATSSVQNLFAKPPSSFAIFAQRRQSNLKSSLLDQKFQLIQLATSIKPKEPKEPKEKYLLLGLILQVLLLIRQRRKFISHQA